MTEAEGVIACIQNADSHSANNAALIVNLEANIKILKDENVVMSEEVNELKIQLNTCKEQVDNTEQYLRINNINICKEQVDNTEQYLRINNINTCKEQVDNTEQYLRINNIDTCKEQVDNTEQYLRINNIETCKEQVDNTEQYLRINNINICKEQVDNTEQYLRINNINTCKEQVDNTEQYLRINNIEIVGLPPMESQNEEDLIIEAMNNLGDINISSDYIDIPSLLKKAYMLLNS